MWASGRDDYGNKVRTALHCHGEWELGFSTRHNMSKGDLEKGKLERSPNAVRAYSGFNGPIDQRWSSNRFAQRPKMLYWVTARPPPTTLAMKRGHVIREPIWLRGRQSSARFVLLRLLLFWSVFLPLGRIWSLDANRSLCNYGTASRYLPTII
jgi:hypothetical protein